MNTNKNAHDEEKEKSLREIRAIMKPEYESVKALLALGLIPSGSDTYVGETPITREQPPEETGQVKRGLEEDDREFTSSRDIWREHKERMTDE